MLFVYFGMIMQSMNELSGKKVKSTPLLEMNQENE